MSKKQLASQRKNHTPQCSELRGGLTSAKAQALAVQRCHLQTLCERPWSISHGMHPSGMTAVSCMLLLSSCAKLPSHARLSYRVQTRVALILCCANCT